RDYGEAMAVMHAQPERADDGRSTGEAHSVREFVERAFAWVELQIEWRGEGAEEQGVDARSGQVLVAIDPRYFRPTEVDHLVGDASKARERLGWKPRTSFDELVIEMVDTDLAAVRGETWRNHGRD